jgi:hypothetical protein
MHVERWNQLVIGRQAMRGTTRHGHCKLRRFMVVYKPCQEIFETTLSHKLSFGTKGAPLEITKIDCSLSLRKISHIKHGMPDLNQLRDG